MICPSIFFINHSSSFIHSTGREAVLSLCLRAKSNLYISHHSLSSVKGMEKSSAAQKSLRGKEELKKSKIFRFLGCHTTSEMHIVLAVAKFIVS